MPVLAAAAHLALLERARVALEDVGWSPASLSAAQGGWLTASAGSKGSPPRAVIAVLGETAYLHLMDGPNPVGIRQLPAQEVGAIQEALGDGSGRILVLASPQSFDAMKEALAGTGWSLSRDPQGWAGAEESAAARADGSLLELVPPSLAEERRERSRKRAFQFMAVAAVLILTAAAVQAWGVHRELEAVEARRAEIRPEVAPLLATRDSLNRLTAQVEAIEELEAGTPLWTRSLVELAAVLPGDTYLTALYASGDTIELEAAGAKAGEAIQALRESGLFAEVRLQGIVERELDEGETVEERFRLWALLPPSGGEGES
jgi:Tfp pilus assembly protein PilN